MYGIKQEHVDRMFMAHARDVAERSNYKSGRRTSVVFVRVNELEGTDVPVAEAANGTPDTYASDFPDEWTKKPLSEFFVEHAERNAIASSAIAGMSLYGTTVYLPWFPCYQCARMLVGVGVKRMVCVEPDWNDTVYHFNESRQILEAGGVKIVFFNYDEQRGNR